MLESDVSHSSATATMERPHRAEDRREALAAARGWRGAEKDVEDAGDGLSAGALLVEGLAEQAGGAILRFGPPIAAGKSGLLSLYTSIVRNLFSLSVRTFY